MKKMMFVKGLNAVNHLNLIKLWYLDESVTVLRKYQTQFACNIHLKKEFISILDEID